MKKYLLFSAICLALTFGSFMTNAQRVKNLEGSASALVGVKKMNAVFTFNDVTVGKYSEADYIAKKVEEYNKKEAGKGDKWKDSWESDKAGRYPPSYIELFEKNCDFALGKYPDDLIQSISKYMATIFLGELAHLLIRTFRVYIIVISIILFSKSYKIYII